MTISEQASARDGATPPPVARHRTQRRLRADDIDALVDCYRAGDAIADLAAQFAINRTTVMAHLNRRNVQRRAATKEWNDDAIAAAANAYVDGYSLADIADRHGLDPQTVANRLRRAGIPIRPRRGSS